MSLDDLIGLIQSEDIWQESIKYTKPSCLVILNTVQSCAVVAEALARSLTDLKTPQSRRKTVLHLSTALAPKDRTMILHEIERRQKKSEWDKTPWYLVATSCVEAGVDLDFSLVFENDAL
jgi:CRISPR-associated endonuclease/helicase Cas3